MTSIKVFESPEILAETLVEKFIATLNKLIDERGEAWVALSGGSTPAKFYRSLAISRVVGNVPWQKVNFFWSDDRCVPPDHPESNFGLANKEFFGPLGIGMEKAFRVEGELDPALAAKRYTEKLASLVPISEGLPEFDILFLGMGEDGHTASIFPHEIDLWGRNELCVVATHPVTGQKRVSFTGHLINNAKTICLLVTGSAKRPVVEQVINRHENYNLYPVSLVQPSNGRLEWWLDSEAAGPINSSVL